MSYEDRFMRKAAQAGPAFAQAVKSYLGFAPRDAAVLLGMASKLSQPSGALLSDNDALAFARLHPRLHPGTVADIVTRINALPPARRADTFLAALAGGGAALHGDMVDASPVFKQLRELSTAYTQAELSDAVTARLGGTRASPAWKAPEGSVRDLLERATVPQATRDFAARFDAGDPAAERGVRHAVADTMQGAIDKLRQPDDLSLRDVVSASFDLHAGEAIAADELGMTAGDDQ